MIRIPADNYFQRLPAALVAALTAGCLALLAVSHTLADDAAKSPPNIVLIFIDDLGQNEIGPYGATQVKTPHLDKMAAEGRKLPHFYATPVCSMSRACLLTGCYNVRVSIPGVLFPQSTVGLHTSEITLAEIAKQKGYATCAIGKWHLGHQPEFLPTRQGFDEYFGIPYSNDMGASKNRPNNPPLPLIRGEKTIETEPDQSQLTRRYTEEAQKFIRDHQKEPFFIYLPHTMVHGPLFASANFKGKSAMGLIGDCIEEIDWSVGQILQTLKETGLDEKTLVIFTSDNGPAGRTAAPLRGSKGSTFEGGVREPCLVRWPGKIPAGTVCNQIAGNIDLLPTFASLLGVEPPKDRVLDGRDISPLLFEADPKPVRDVHLYFSGGGKLDAIRQGDWKLFLSGVPQQGAKGKKAKNAKDSEPKAAPADTGPALFNLRSDPGESTNVAAANAELVAKLKALAEERLAEIKANTRPAGQAAKQ